MLAEYDLSRAPPTWDFATWLLHAEMERVRQGADRLRVAIRMNPVNNGFRDDALPPPLDERRHMLDHIVRPLIRLIGAEAADGDVREGARFPYMLSGIVERARAGAAVPRFRSSARAAALVAAWMGPPPYVTITLREVEYWPMRNSNNAEWLRVVDALEDRGFRVIVVRDTAKAGEPLPCRTAPWASVDIDLRCALYAGAALNLAVANGPTTLLVCGEAPYLIFKQIVAGSITQTPEFQRRHLGLDIGDQLPWAGPQQRLAWADDEFGAIMHAIDSL